MIPEKKKDFDKSQCLSCRFRNSCNLKSSRASDKLKSIMCRYQPDPTGDGFFETDNETFQIVQNREIIQTAIYSN